MLLVILVGQLCSAVVSDARARRSHRLRGLMGSHWAETEARALQVYFDSDPVTASQLGIHRCDSLYLDYRPEALRATDRRLDEQVGILESLDMASDGPSARLDRKLLAMQLRNRAREISVERRYSWSPAYYLNDLQSGISTLLLHPYGPPELRATSLLARLRAFPRVLAQARANLSHPPARHCRAARELLGEVPSFLRSSVLPAVSGASAPVRAALAEAVDSASSACVGFSEHLRRLESVGGEDFFLGRAAVDWRLRNLDGLEFGSDTLAQLGERWLAEIRAAQARVNELRLAAGMHDSAYAAPADFTLQQLMASHVEDVEVCREYVKRRDLVTFPARIGALVPIVTPRYLRSVVPGQAMEPPCAFDSSLAGVYYLGSAMPDSLTPANQDRLYSRMRNHFGRGGAVHEGYPGHHLQLSIAKQVGSATRKVAASTVQVEGWALYCEELMGREGFYGPDSLAWLQRVLGGMAFRAARVVVDARMNTGRMGFSEAVALMRSVRDDSAAAVGEVTRYMLEPTQPMSYLVGKSLILGIKAEVRRRDGAKFSQKAFHDRLLSYGSIPTAWIAREWLGFVPAVGPIRDRVDLAGTRDDPARAPGAR